MSLSICFRIRLTPLSCVGIGKAAVLSALLRSPIFFAAYRKEGLALALGAMLAQFFFRTVFGGVNGAIIQAFSKVEPAWHALLTVPLVLAVFSHVIEFIVSNGL